MITLTAEAGKRSNWRAPPRGPEMPTICCRIEGCEYETSNVEPVIAAALIITSHRAPNWPAQAAKVKRPSISSAGTTEGWQYFKLRWSDYVKATKLEETDRVVQLLECRDDQLRKYLTGRKDRGWSIHCQYEKVRIEYSTISR